LVEKLPTTWEKIPENLRGDFFDSHCTSVMKKQLKRLNVPESVVE